MQNKDLTDSINDPSRPLSVSPEVWSMRRGSIPSAKFDEEKVVVAKVGGEMTGLEQVDMGVDSIIKGVGQIQEGLKQLNSSQMSADEKAILNKVKDLIDTAISPYTADIIEQLDGLEGKE